MLDRTGVPTPDQVRSRFPEEKALLRPKAILECYEDIPCNPCSTGCPFGAIVIGEDLNAQPHLIVERCTGCGLCVAICPGLAIMTARLKEGRAVFQIPYELLPLPRVGDKWIGVDREGRPLGPAQIEKVVQKTDRTTVLTVSIEGRHLYDFATVRCPK